MARPHSNPPPIALMHLTFLFSGAATLLLGPTLPVYTQRWHLQDSGSGLLLSAQFCGLFLGSLSVFRNLQRTLLCGYALSAAALGLLVFAANAPSGYTCGLLALFLLGLGLGQITTSVNVLSAQRFADARQRSSQLSLLNFSWSAGAIVSPVIAGIYLARGALTYLLLTFIPVAALLSAALIWFSRAGSSEVEREAASPAAAATLPRIAMRTLLYFFLLFLLYGGLEATVGGWLSTYTLRYTHLGLAAAAYCNTALWGAFAAGRAAATLVLRYAAEGVVRACGIVLSTCGVLCLQITHTGTGIILCAAVIGLGLAAFFPVTFSRLIARSPTPRQAGAATANIGLGSALFPFLAGLISTASHSLEVAMIMPIALGLALLALFTADGNAKRARG